MESASKSLPCFSLKPAALVAGLFCSLPLFATAAGMSASGGLLLVANKGNQTLSIVDPVAGKEIATIAEDGVTAHEVAASPDGKLAYVPIYGNAGVSRAGTDGQLIRVMDLADHRIVATFDFGKGVRPHLPRFNPKNGLLYVTTELEKSVTVIDPKTLKIVGSIPTGQLQSHMLAISHDGSRGYTANVGSGTVSVLDLSNNQLVTQVKAATVVQRIAVSPDDRWAVTADQTKLRLVIIDTRTNTVGESIPLPGIGFGTAFTPDGAWLLVTLPATNQVGVVDFAKKRVVQVLDVPKSPQEILMRPDGAVAYVSCDASKQVAAIDVKNWKIEKLIDVGPDADGLSWAATP